MSAKEFVTLGIGASPGGIKSFILLGLVSAGPSLQLDSSHTWSFTIDGVDVTDYVDPSTVAMTDAEGAEVDTLYLELVDPSGLLSLSDWQEIIWIIDPGTADEIVWFGGFVISPRSTTFSGGQGYVWQLKCEGYATLLARLPAGLRTWVDSYPGAIVEDLLDQAGLTSQDTEQGTLSYVGNDTTTAVLKDTTQVWTDWSTIAGNAAGYAAVVTNSDGTVSWGYLGEETETAGEIEVYTDLALTTRGWNGVLPIAGSKTALSYHVRRGELFSGHRPINTTHVQTGDNALLSFGTTADETVAQVLARLAKQLGWVWRVSAEAELYFGEAATNDPAPFNVSDGANATYVAGGYFPARADTFALSLANGMEISNRVLIHGGAKASDETQETFVADGVTRIYQLEHRNLIDITVLVNGVVVADGTVWWNTFDDRIVLVNYAEGWIWFVEDFLQNDDGITVIYRYWIRLEYEQRDENSIIQRRQVFTYELTDPSITSEERAEEVATQYLADYGGGQRTGSFEVWRLGLRAGQDVKLKFPGYGINEGYTIRKLDCRIDGSNTGLVVYVEFGSRQMQLSQAVAGSGALTDDLLRVGQIGPATNNMSSSIAKPFSTDASLAKQYTALVDGSSNDAELTLPAAITRTGQSILVVRIDTSAYAVTIVPAFGETINGGSSLSVPHTGYAAVLCYSDGLEWYGLELGFQAGDLALGGIRHRVAVKSSSYTLTSDDHTLAFSSTATATLPLAAGSGQTYRIIARPGVTVTIAPDGSDTVKGATSQTIQDGEDMILTDVAAGVWE